MKMYNEIILIILCNQDDIHFSKEIIYKVKRLPVFALLRVEFLLHITVSSVLDCMPMFLNARYDSVA